jgi:hypothetical protein
MLEESLAIKRTIIQVNKVSGHQVIVYSRVAIKTYIKDIQNVA